MVLNPGQEAHALRIGIAEEQAPPGKIRVETYLEQARQVSFLCSGRGQSMGASSTIDFPIEWPTKFNVEMKQKTTSSADARRA
jgi:hypothetical protein